MSEPMEDKSLERSAEELASGLGMGVLGGRPEDREWLIRETTRALKLYAKQENAALQARLDLRSDYVKQTDAQIDEQAEMITTLQSQITALKSQLPEGMEHCTIRFIECPVGHGRLTADNWAKSECLYCQITAIKKLINGASLHPETGVSLVDDVRDLVKELARCKNSVPGSIKSYIAQVEHEKKEAAKLKAENTRLRETLEKIENPKEWPHKPAEDVANWMSELAKAALEGGR